MLATRKVRSCSLGRTKNKAVLEPLPREASMFASGSTSSTIAAARMDLPPLPTNPQSAAKGSMPTSTCAERTAVAGKIYGGDSGQQSRQAPGAIKKLEPRAPSAGPTRFCEAGRGIRRRKMTTTACLKPLDSLGDRSSNASPEPPFMSPVGEAEAKAPWERDLFSATAKQQVGVAENVQTSTAVKSQQLADSQCVATSPISAPSTPALSKPSPRRPPLSRSRPSPRPAAVMALPRPGTPNLEAAAPPFSQTEQEDTEQQVVEKVPLVVGRTSTASAPTAVALTPDEVSERARARLVFRQMFAHELCVNGGDANAAAASTLHRLTTGVRR